MAVTFSVPQAPQRGMRRRSAVAASVLALGGAILSTTFLFGMGPSRHLYTPATVAAAEMLPFVYFPTVGSESPRCDSLVALAAKGKTVARTSKEGGKPQRTPWGQAEAEEDKPQPVDPVKELNTQLGIVARKTKLWKSLKGKFVPKGPKPWDEHRFVKVCIQVRLQSKQAANTKIINQCLEELRRISGYHPKVLKAKTNVATLGWRVGYPCGVGVTLYGQRMIDFMHRMNTVTLPRVRDFEGLLPNSFDRYGNFWMSFQSQDPFKELDELIDEREIVHGFDLGIVNNCFTQPDGLKLMKDFGFPFGDPRTRYLRVNEELKRGKPKRTDKDRRR